MLRQTYQEEAGKSLMETERAAELESKLHTLTARYTGQRKQLGELYGQLAQYKQALEAEQQYRDVVMAHAQQAIAAAEANSSGGASEEAVAAAVAEAVAEEARKIAAGDSSTQDEAVRDALKNYHELRKSRSQVADLNEKLRQCNRQIKILEMQGGGDGGGGSGGGGARRSALGIGGMGGVGGIGFGGGMPMQAPRGGGRGGAGGRPLAMPRGRSPSQLPAGARGARGARPRLPPGARGCP